MTMLAMAGEAVPKITRRLFLARSATVVAVGIVPVSVAASTPAPIEPEALIAACDAFDVAFADYQLAVSEKNKALAAYEALLPPMPSELIAKRGEYRCTEDEVNGEDKRVYLGPGGSSRRIYRAYACDQWADIPEMAEKAEIARRFEAAQDEARQATRLGGYVEAVYYKISACRQLAEVVGKSPAATPLGLIRKATVAHALASIEDCQMRALYLFGQDFWAEMVAVLGREV